MDVISQAPQPTIKCYHSIVNGKASNELYQNFTPTSLDRAGKNLQSYTFENSVDSFGGSFSFTVKEDIPKNELYSSFMDEVQPLDIVEISEKGDGERVDFIGVVTKVSVGGIASNLNKTVTVSGKSIEWLFTYYNMNTDIKACIFQNDAANAVFKVDLAKNGGSQPIKIKDVVVASLKVFNEYATKIDKEKNINNTQITNTIVGEIIKKWYGDNFEDFVESSDDEFLYPISSNLFSSGKINVIDYIRKLLPSPVYEIFGYINDKNKPKLCVRKVPFDKPEGTYTINPLHLTDFTLTRSCEEVYTAFMPYIEGSSQSADFYMNLQAAEAGTEKGYNAAISIPEKVKVYGYQLLTCSFVGYNQNPKTGKEEIDNKKMQNLADSLKKWFGNLDEMFNGDFTLVNVTKDTVAKIGEWVGFSQGLFYVYSANHTWNYGDNPMINYQVGRGGKWSDGNLVPLKELSVVYREFN